MPVERVLAGGHGSTSPGVISPGANISRTPQTASDVDWPSLTSASSAVIGVPPSPRVTWTARRAPLRPGCARCIGTSSAYSVTPSSARESSRSTSPGCSASTCSIGRSTAATSARTVISTWPTASRTAAA